MVRLPVSSHGTSAFLERKERVGDPQNPAQQLPCGPSFAVLGEFLLTCSILRFCLPPRLLLPQWLGGHWAAVVFTSKQDTRRYLHVIWICLPPESGNWRREDLHLSSYSVLSAAHPSSGFRLGQFPSGRALARAAVGRRVSDIHSFDRWSGFLIPPWLTFPAALPKIPYVGFSPVRLQAPGT